MKNFKMKRKNEKNKKNFPERGFEPQIFRNFHALDLNFHVKPEIKSKQASKRDSTLVMGWA